jgi:hypothetical protein
MGIAELAAGAADDGRVPGPSLASEWHPTKNGELRFGELSHGSGKKVWWLGPCGHEWETETGAAPRKEQAVLYVRAT